MSQERNYPCTDSLSLAIGIWLCTVPFLFFVAAALFDVHIAWASVVVAFVVILSVCNMICAFRLYKEE
ncbi:MAG: hypothetical protein HY694_14470 [Deltaproteobacteria bacterium]|nr:hypothetical protein [Deltaproteobacteria bacterium]